MTSVCQLVPSPSSLLILQWPLMGKSPQSGRRRTCRLAEPRGEGGKPEAASGACFGSGAAAEVYMLSCVYAVVLASTTPARVDSIASNCCCACPLVCPLLRSRKCRSPSATSLLRLQRSSTRVKPIDSSDGRPSKPRAMFACQAGHACLQGARRDDVGRSARWSPNRSGQ